MNPYLYAILIIVIMILLSVVLLSRIIKKSKTNEHTIAFDCINLVVVVALILYCVYSLVVS